MSERRTFAKTIVLSDAFLDLPISARCLYFTLGMVAYDKGIVINARTMAGVIGARPEDVELLVERKYIMETDDGHYQIVHWYENNGIGETAKKRNNYTYRKWREEVLTRDGHKCAECGSSENLEVHHIKEFSIYPELRFDVDNGITLCRSCHRKHHFKGKTGEEENTTLVCALEDAADRGGIARFTYDEFRDIYGEGIFASAQPKRALDAAADALADRGFSLTTGIHVRRGDTHKNGFAISPIS